MTKKKELKTTTPKEYTLETSMCVEIFPELRHDFLEELNDALIAIAEKHMAFVAGSMNLKRIKGE